MGFQTFENSKCCSGWAAKITLLHSTLNWNLGSVYTSPGWLRVRVGFEPGSALTPSGIFFLVYMNPGPLLFETYFINPGQTCLTWVGNIFPSQQSYVIEFIMAGFITFVWLSNSADLFLYAVISFFIKDLPERKSSQPVFTWRNFQNSRVLKPVDPAIV